MIIVGLFLFLNLVTCVVKRLRGIKFDMKWVTLKPSLALNWVMFLGGFSVPLTVIQTVNLYSKFHSFLVRI